MQTVTCTLAGVSPRVRVVVVVSVVAAFAATAAVGGALLQGRGERTGGEAHGQTETRAPRTGGEPPALELAILARGDREARALRAAEATYERGNRRRARRAFEALLRRNPSSVEAAIGVAITGWPNRTLERLERLVERHPASGVARLNLGLALVATGDMEAAREQWREAKRRAPDSAAALRADDLLHPDMPPGRPQFIVDGTLPSGLARLSPERRLAALERRARRGGARDWLLYGSALEQAGRRPSAERAYDRALALSPASVEARTAAAVVRFDKDDPSKAFSRLGPLAREHPRAGVVRFHLGLLLLWLPSVDEARRQLRLAAEVAPESFYAREANRVLARLEGVK